MLMNLDIEFTIDIMDKSRVLTNPLDNINIFFKTL